MTKSTIQVKPSLQIPKLPQPNPSSTVSSEPSFLNSQAWTSRNFTLTPTWMIMNTCDYHNESPPQYSIDENHIEHLFINNKILVKIRKGMYGLPKSGQPSYIALIKHLKLHGYTRAGFTPGLFKHATRDTKFSLVLMTLW